MSDSVELLDARAPSRRWRSPVRRWVMPMSGSRRAGAEHVVEVHHRLAHAHEHEVVERLDAAEVQRLVEDLDAVRLRPNLIAPGRAERAGQRAARLRGDADRAAAVAVAHQHGLDRAPVGGVEQRLDRAVARVRLVRELERRERHALVEPRRAARPAGRSSRRSRAAPPAVQRHTWRARKAGSPASASVRSRSSRSMALLWWQRHAARQVPRPRRGRLAARRRAADLRRARDGRRRGRHATRRATSTDRTPSPSTAAPVGGAEQARVVYVAQQAGRRRLDRAATPTAARPSSTSSTRDRAALPGRAPRRRHHRPDPAHQRRRARPPAHAPELRGAEDLPRAWSRNAAGARAGAARAARGRRARRRPHGARARCAGSRPASSRSRSTRAASARSGACARRSGTASSRSSASPSARCGSGSLPRRRATAA